LKENNLAILLFGTTIVVPNSRASKEIYVSIILGNQGE